MRLFLKNVFSTCLALDSRLAALPAELDCAAGFSGKAGALMPTWQQQSTSLWLAWQVVAGGAAWQRAAGDDAGLKARRADLRCTWQVYICVNQAAPPWHELGQRLCLQWMTLLG